MEVINRIERILHVSDVHIRNYHRHQEYKEVFERMFQKFDELIIPGKTIIFLGGDIAHSKNEVSPELISLITYLFRECTKRCVTILIPGNHDANLINEHRMDVLTPIVESLNDPKLLYWKETGVYELGNIVFSHFSVFGSMRKWIPANKIESNKEYKIALHHGAVHGSKTDLDFNIENDAVKVNKFENFDIVLLGDIHKLQTLQLYQEKKDKKKPIIIYPGSVIQQDHGEELVHGFVSWDVDDRNPTFIPIENNYGFYTAYLLDNKFLNPVESLPKNLKLRIFHENCTKEYIHKILTSFKKKNTLLDVVIRDQKPKTIFAADGREIAHSNSRDIEYQNSMLKLFFENENIIDIDLDFLRHYNRNLNSKIQSDVSVIRNVRWKPIYLEFTNTFSFGENNRITFEDLNGAVGLFGENTAGKSNSLCTFVFCVFDKYTRGFKAINVMNNKKSFFQTEFCFEMEGKQFIINRNGTRHDRKDTVKVEVTFKSIQDGIETDLTGKDRDDTNRKIREYLGTYEDFMTTVFTSQNAPRSFIDMSISDRNELFCRFLDIQIFNELYQLAKEDNKSTLFRIKDLESLDIDIKLPKYKEERQCIETQINDLDLTIQNLKNENDNLQNQIIDNSLLIQNNVFDINLEQCKLDLTTAESELQKEIEVIKQIKLNLKNKEKELFTHNHDLSKYNVDVLSNANIKQIEAQKKLQKLYIEVTKINSNIKSKNEKVEHLKDHEYDPNCKYCIQNKFVVDAKKAENELILLNEEKIVINNEIQNYKNILDLIQDDLEMYNQLQELQTQIKNTNNDIILLKNKLESKMYHGKILQNKIQDQQTKINSYYENKFIIEKNNKLKQYIVTLKQQSSDLNNILDEKINTLIQLKGQLTKLEHEINEYEKSLINLNVLRHESSNYEYYCQAMSKDGIPNLILSDALPLIENEVNGILGQLVDFTIKLEMTDKNNISGYVLYDMEQSWAIELVSGMEKFILSMAFRVGLMNITTLPSANFMLIDEGFGVLDATKLNDVYKLFDYLKSKFDFILCVSHIDALKDMVDTAITMEKTGRVSRIRH